MIAIMMFSGVAAALVHLAGRRDAARDPRLTGLVLGLLAVLPFMAALLPKYGLLPVGGGGSETGFPWMAWIGRVWLAGLAVSLLRLALAGHALGRWRKRSRLIACLGRIEIRELGGLKGPVAAGVFQPVVYVPEAWYQWPRKIRNIVLDHETAHHERRDPLWRWLAGISVAVNWFNPLVWWMARRMSMQCEFACDSRVLRKGFTAAEYAGLLCDLAEDPVFRGPAMAMAERASLEQRVKRLAGSPPIRRVLPVSLLIGFALAASVALALVGPKTGLAEKASLEETHLRWSADPFPGEAGGGR